MRQLYGFSRFLALGEFGGDGVDSQLVTHFMGSVPPRELELMLAASHMSERSGNFHRLIAEAGLGQIEAGLRQKTYFLERLDL